MGIEPRQTHIGMQDASRSLFQTGRTRRKEVRPFCFFVPAHLERPATDMAEAVGFEPTHGIYAVSLFSRQISSASLSTSPKCGDGFCILARTVLRFLHLARTVATNGSICFLYVQPRISFLAVRDEIRILPAVKRWCCTNFSAGFVAVLYFSAPMVSRLPQLALAGHVCYALSFRGVVSAIFLLSRRACGVLRETRKPADCDFSVFAVVSCHRFFFSCRPL